MPSTPPASNDIVISGVAATGAPLANAAVAIIDRKGNTVGSGKTDAAGFFRLNVNPLYGGPLVVQATRENPVAGKDMLVALADTKTSTTVNVNTLSNLVAALVSVTGSPSTLAADLASGKVTFDAKALLTKWKEAEAVIAPLLTALKADIAAIRSGSAPADGTGPDQVLDALGISITSNKDTSTIEITVKTTDNGNGQQLPVIRFTNAMPLALILAQNGITPTEINGQPITTASLPAPGTSPQVADLLERMTACFALPLKARANYETTTVTAAQCRALFSNNDPTTYRHSGAAVGPGGAFPGLFLESGTGASFVQGTFEYKRDNGDIVFSFASLSRDLTPRREESVATMGPDGKLRLIGDQYRFAGSVNPMAELRSYMDGALPALISTGYDIKVPVQEINDENIVRVDVTSPRGTKYSLVRGSSSMTLPKLDRNFVPEKNADGTIADSSSAFVRLNVITAVDFAFGGIGSADKVTYTGERDLQLLQQTESDEIIASYPSRGIWTMEYFTKMSGSPVARQTVRTRARAMSLQELSESGLVSPLRAYTLALKGLDPLLPEPTAPDPVKSLFFPLQDLRSTSYAWSTIAPPPYTPPLAPMSIRVLGRRITPESIPPYVDFVDSLALPPDTRQAKVPCELNTFVSHCDAQGLYMKNTWLDGAQLLSQDGNGREFSSMLSTWRINN
ncbi:hypothetical protein [Noviherbaspirillum soli]|uniref:hypothetical protein n=1 Tax=Noviherbaspirillum soli TaxID=1064518 RepID=UPI00188B542A|nr:hypothetical protein [Noviherbaspirillum soli]